MKVVKEPYKVSVGVPVYGVEKYIERCARSLFGQTYENLEIIFVNDCTKDRSIEVLKETLVDFPNRKGQIKIIDHSQNQGLGAARNTAVENASGDFLMWVDSDDYIDIDCINQLVAKQIETNADIVACDAFFDYGLRKEIYCNRLSENACDACLDICACRVKHMVWGRLYRRNLYVENHICVKKGCDMGEDHQVVPLLYYYAQKVAVLHKPLYYYYKGNGSAYSSSFSSKKAKQWLESISILELFFKDKPVEFQNALNVGAAIMTAQLMAGCSRGGDKEMYLLIRKRMNGFDHSVIKNVPASYRVFFYLKSRSLSKFYAQIGHWIKRRK